jgi:guanylate kinase
LNHNPDYSYSISATTRKKRSKEREGVDYFFLSDEQFDRYIERGEFIEWSAVHTYRYGTLKKPVQTMLDHGKVVLLDIDVIGGMNVKKIFPDNSLLIFLKPPSIDELIRRLHGRKSETKDQIQKRLERLPIEMSYANRYDIQIVNHIFKDTVKQVEQIIQRTYENLEVEIK